MAVVVRVKPDRRAGQSPEITMSMSIGKTMEELSGL